MTEQNNDILFDLRDGIGRVTFNRPQARNAFTFQMYERARRDLRGSEQGSRHQGADLHRRGRQGVRRRERTSISSARSRRRRTRSTTRRATTACSACWKSAACRPSRRSPASAPAAAPAIAACCDLRIGTKTARFGFPIARTLGNCLSMANYGRLAALLGPARVKDIIFTARLVEAQEALALGLLSEVRRGRHSAAAAGRRTREATCQPRTTHAARHQGSHAPASADPFGGRRRGPHPDVLHEQGFSRRPRRVPHQAHAAVGGGVGESSIRSSPRRRGPRAGKRRNWIPACAGMSGDESTPPAPR